MKRLADLLVGVAVRELQKENPTMRAQASGSHEYNSLRELKIDNTPIRKTSHSRHDGMLAT